MILAMLDPLFRRRMIPLLNDKCECRFDTETDTIETIFKGYKYEDPEIQKLLDDLSTNTRLQTSLDVFKTFTIRSIISRLVMMWKSWDNPILMYPERVKLLNYPEVLISGETEKTSDRRISSRFKISSNLYKSLQQLRQWGESSYDSLTSAVFIEYWNKAVVDDLKLDDSFVWRFVDLADLMRMVQNNVPNYNKPLPDTDLDYPHIPCDAVYKDGTLQFLTIGHFQILRHHPLMEKNLERQRRYKHNKEHFVG